MIDYHVHTALCYHASGTMEAYIRRAVEIGLSEICFLDHLTMQPSAPNLSMTPPEVPLYVQALQRFKHQYQGNIQVKIGLEIDFNPQFIDLFQEIIASYPFDVIGGALHFPGGVNIVSRSSDWCNGSVDADYASSLFLEQLHHMLEYDYFDMVCHLDLLKKFGWQSDGSFDNNLDGILTTVKNKDLTVEINTGGYDHALQEPYPAPHIINRCREKGIPITLGSDAHSPDAVGRHYDKALPLLKAAGYRHLATFTRRQRDLITIVFQE